MVVHERKQQSYELQQQGVAFQWLALAYGAPKYSSVPANNILHRLAYTLDNDDDDDDHWIK